MKISVGIEKRDWGSGRHTWREIGHKTKMAGKALAYSTRQLPNKVAKKRWFGGDSIKAY